ncbi:hypothetical protein BJ973_002614 [Actinoplanes tereljensis]|uniref:DUF2157 domain-containing protein n=1 Tax=Paractinoplanes tereljensis TaxID=571912 RepID=A0A919NQA5_9ACTN|nr:DUF2157 domain-containing protein [Actinoplanes tereljensis]GIF22290.1 hypothetical protein Ate02nite_50200 [Actinoplanes tereljensis]
MELPGDAVDPDRLDAALERLVQRGVLDAAQAGAVRQEYAGPVEAGRPHGLRRQLGEIAGYLGASFVVGATLLFLGEQWDSLGRGGRVAILGAIAVVLLGAGVAVRSRSRAGDSVRRRLSSTLLTGAGLATGTAVYAMFDTSTTDAAGLVASVAGLAVVVGGYLLARSALGQLAAAVGAFAVVASLLSLLHLGDTAMLGAGTIALGLGWVLLLWRRLVAEHRFALAIAVTFGLGGAQLLVASDGGTQNYLGYALTAIVAGICFTAYARLRDWVVLAGGVIGATLVVPEFLYDISGGSLGASGVMLAAGVTLLAGSLAGLRLRNTTDSDPLAAAH